MSYQITVCETVSSDLPRIQFSVDVDELCEARNMPHLSG